LNAHHVIAAAMARIERSSLMTLEAYARERQQFRAKVIAHKKNRTIRLGSHITLIYEDELTIRYQIQEMLRVERIYDEEGIQEELDAYNPLVPDGRNFKATLMLEYPEPDDRRKWLERLIGIEDKIWMRVDDCGSVWAVADEDLERQNENKTSSVHFLRLELSENMAQGLKGGAGLWVGVEHPHYNAAVEAPAAVRGALVKDLA
jgi:hypothetical protein